MTFPAIRLRRWPKWRNPSSKRRRPTRPAPKPTGKKETINGYETQEYVSDSPKFHASYWVATTYPDYANILQQMSVLQKGAFASITKGMPDYHALPGMPLRTHVKIPTSRNHKHD